MSGDFDIARSVLARADRADIRTDPFPHIVIDDALAAGLYERLSATRPSYAQIASPPPHPSNRRVPHSARMMLQVRLVDEAWIEFAEIHIRREITEAVADLFRDHWPDFLPSPDEIARSRFGLIERESYDDHDILTDARLEVQSPVLETPSSHRRGHLDMPNRIFSCLLYLRDPGDDSIGADLVLYRWKGSRADKLVAFELDQDMLEPVSVLPYAANRLVLFPNGPDALHGVSDRHPTPHERAYAFITAEVKRDLF